MKKKQKYCIITLCIVVFLVSIFCIFQFIKKDKLPSFYPESVTSLYDLDQEDLHDMGVEEEWLVHYHALSSLLAISAERIFMFELEEGRGDQVREACQEYLKNLKSEFVNSSQMEIIKKYKEYRNEDYYILVISENANGIMKSIKERILE